MKIFYVYPTNRLQIYQNWQKGAGPSTLMYGFCELKKEGQDVNFQDTHGLKKKIIKYLFLPFEIIFFKLVGLSLHFDHVFSQIGALRNSDIIISTSDSISIPLLFLKKIGLFQKQKIICLCVDLINRVNEEFAYSYLRKIYEAADRIIVFSKEEKKQYDDKWHLKNVDFVQFGIDVDFFRGKGESDNEKENILTIGRDRSRDYQFFMALAKKMSKEKFVVVCSQKNIVNLKIPGNVELILDANYGEIKKWLQRVFVFLLPVHELHRASGQIAYLEALASGLPIIVSPVSSIKENYDFDAKDGVTFIEKDIVKWTDKIKKLKSSRDIFKRNNIPNIEHIAGIIKKYSEIDL